MGRKMAFLARARIIPRLVIQRPIVLARRQMMTAVPKVTSPGGRLDDMLDVIVHQKKEMVKLREQVEELERKNEDLQARMNEFEEEGLGASGIDRDTLEEKLNELDDKLDEAKDIVDGIRQCLE